MTENILFISPQPFFQWRGSPIRVRSDVLVLIGLGYKVDVLTLPIGENVLINGASITRVINPFMVREIPIGPSFHKFIFDILLLSKGLMMIRRKKYAVIHGVEEAGIIALIVGRVAGARVVYEKHSDPFSYKKGLLKNTLLTIYSFAERFTAKHVQAVICTGPGLMAQVKKTTRFTPVYTVSDIPSSFVEPDSGQVIKKRIELQQKKDDTIITFVGSFARYQGIDLLMQTIPEVIKLCPNVQFIIIGGSGKEIEKWTAILNKLEAASVVNFLGLINPDALPVILCASDILLSTRISGVNTPLKLIDYLKAGRPVVATDVDANRLIMNENTAVFSAPDPKTFAKAIISLVENPVKREILGVQARKIYETSFHFDIFSGKLKYCYDALLN